MAAEIALHLPTPEALEALATRNGFVCLGPLAPAARHPAERETLERLDRALREILGEVSIGSVRFGAGFCPHLGPSVARVLEARSRARAAGLGFTFVAPFAPEGSMSALREVFSALAEEGTCDVVFQDWGALRVLRSEFPELVPVQGRLLSKSLRDPRVTPLYAEHPPEGEATSALRATASEPWVRLLLENGVRGFVADPLPQGEDLPRREGLAVSVALPFGVVTTGRICLAAALRIDGVDRFGPVVRCGRECETHLLAFEPPAPGATLLQKGNTTFFTQSDRTIGRVLEAARAGSIDRLVLEPGLPMWA